MFSFSLEIFQVTVHHKHVKENIAPSEGLFHVLTDAIEVGFFPLGVNPFGENWPILPSDTSFIIDYMKIWTISNHTPLPW